MEAPPGDAVERFPTDGAAGRVEADRRAFPVSATMPNCDSAAGVAATSVLWLAPFGTSRAERCGPNMSPRRVEEDE